MDSLHNQPHGGQLVNQILTDEAREEELRRACEYPQIVLDHFAVADLELIATGALSPLTGFMNHDDYQAVLKRNCLSNGVVWTFPITLNVSEDRYSKLKNGSRAALIEESGNILGTIRIDDRFRLDKALETQLLYQSKRIKQNGLERLQQGGEWAVGGEVCLLNRPSYATDSPYRLNPNCVREIFKKLGWKRIVAFQAPNPISHSRYSVEKCALEIVDGLFLQPHFTEFGLTSDLFESKIEQHKSFIHYYYPPTRIILSFLPWVSRHAGPREVAIEAIIKKNFGCTHYIVAEKQYKMYNFYTLMDFRRLFDELAADDLGITPIFAEETFYCRKCKGIVTAQNCPHDQLLDEVMSPSGVNEMLAKGDLPPLEFVENAVVPLLIDSLWNGFDSCNEPLFVDTRSQLNPKLQRLKQ